MNWQTDFLAAHPCLTHLTLCKVNFCWLQILLNNHPANRLPPVSLVCCTNSWRLQACLSCLWPHTSNRSLRKSQENTVKENTVTVASWRTVENHGGLWRQATVLKCFPQSSAAFASPRHSKRLQCLTAIMSNRIIKGGKDGKSTICEKSSPSEIRWKFSRTKGTSSFPSEMYTTCSYLFQVCTSLPKLHLKCKGRPAAHFAVVSGLNWDHRWPKAMHRMACILVHKAGPCVDHSSHGKQILWNFWLYLVMSRHVSSSPHCC